MQDANDINRSWLFDFRNQMVTNVSRIVIYPQVNDEISDSSAALRTIQIGWFPFPTDTPTATTTPTETATPTGTEPAICIPNLPAGTDVEVQAFAAAALPNCDELTPTPSTPECIVTPNSAAVQNLYGYQTAFDALRADTSTLANVHIFDANEMLRVDRRSQLYRNIVRVENVEFPNEWYWIDAADGRVTIPQGYDSQGCNALETDTSELYPIQVLDDVARPDHLSDSDTSFPSNWSSFERREIAQAVDAIGTVFMSISSRQPLNALAAFSTVYSSVPSVYPPYILLIRANSTTDSSWRPPNQTEGNDADIPDVTVTLEYNGTRFTVLYPDINDGNCKAFEGAQIQVSDPLSSPRNTLSVYRPYAMVCNGRLLNDTYGGVPITEPPSPVAGEASQHTIVHEFGHMLDYLTNLSLTNIINPSNFILGGCESITTRNRSSTVMGLFNNRWVRGSRGWGSAPPFSIFLQSPEPDVQLEAAADIFLNWVYRTIYNGQTQIAAYHTTSETAPAFGCIPLTNQTPTGQIVETWVGGGFYNRTPRDNQTIIGAPFDWALSGDIRQAFMIDVMNLIFAVKGW